MINRSFHLIIYRNSQFQIRFLFFVGQMFLMNILSNKFCLFFFQIFALSVASRAVKRSLYSAKFPLALNEMRSVISLNSYFGKIIQFCSGVLLTERIVLTAAHCVYRDKFGLADIVHAKGVAWSAYSTDFVIRTDFMFLEMEESICADIALVFLPPKVIGILSAIKFTKFTENKWFDESEPSGSKIYALGYGITELDHVSLRPRKVPLKRLKEKVPKCSLEFYFADSALSCAGDSGGPAIYYSTNVTEGKYNILKAHKPILLGIVSQLVIYANPTTTNNCDETNHCSPSDYERSMPEQIERIGTKTMKNRTTFIDHQIVEGCRRAHKLLIVYTMHIQKWIKMLIENEQNADRREQYIEALKSMLGDQ